MLKSYARFLILVPHQIYNRMIQFRKHTEFGKSAALSFVGVTEITVPHQAMSLKEILDRFTRKEKLPVGKDVVFYDQDYEHDLEKLSRMDLTERDEFLEFQRSVKARYERQEAAKKAGEEAAKLAASTPAPQAGA